MEDIQAVYIYIPIVAKLDIYNSVASCHHPTVKQHIKRKHIAKKAPTLKRIWPLGLFPPVS